jgi:hypothetical protein
LIATISAKDEGLGYRDPKRAALGAFAVPISRTIDYALKGLKLGSDHDTPSQLAPDHQYPFETFTATNAQETPWKHIKTIALIKLTRQFPHLMKMKNAHHTQTYRNHKHNNFFIRKH